jgi:hypothetical protein
MGFFWFDARFPKVAGAAETSTAVERAKAKLMQCIEELKVKGKGQKKEGGRKKSNERKKPPGLQGARGRNDLQKEQGRHNVSGRLLNSECTMATLPAP